MTLKYTIQNPKSIIFCLEESLSIMITQVPTVLSFLHYINLLSQKLRKIFGSYISHTKNIMCFLFLSKVNPIFPSRTAMHVRGTVSGAYMESHVKVFSGRVLDGEATLMPASRQWLREAASEVGGLET